MVNKMINFTSEQINKAFDDLSPEKSDAMFGVDIDSKIKELATKYNLNEEQSKNIDYYVTLSIIGLLREGLLSETITTELKISPETSARISSDLKSFVFDVIQNKITETQERIDILSKEETEIIDPRFESMPDDVKEAIVLSNWKEILYKISADNKLNIEQMGILEDITVRTMKNEINPDKYEEEVTAKINVDKEKIEAIVKEVSEKIFQEIRKIMREEDTKEKKEEKSENVSVDDDVPVPPYANKQESASVKEVSPNTEAKPLFNNSQSMINGEIQNLENDSLTKVSTANSTPSNFSIPHVGIAKQTISSAPISSSPAKPHDPYREVI